MTQSNAGEEIVVLCTNAAREALHALVPLFERTSPHRIKLTVGGGPGMAAKIRQGAVADLFIGPREFSDPLLAEGHLAAGTRVDFARSSAGVAVRAGAPRPDIGSTQAFKRALVAAKSVAYSAGASGIHFETVLAALGIAEQVKAKKATPRPGELVGAVLERGDAEIGVQQMSELIPFKGIDILGPLPVELQKEILYGATRMATARTGDAAQAFVHFLRSAAARPIIEHSGMSPI